MFSIHRLVLLIIKKHYFFYHVINKISRIIRTWYMYICSYVCNETDSVSPMAASCLYLAVYDRSVDDFSI